MVFCKTCFTHFDKIPKNKLSRQAKLDEHELIFGQHKPILSVIPEEGYILEFDVWSKTQHHSITICADIETLLVKSDEKIGKKTTTTQSHHLMSFEFLVKSTFRPHL